MTQIEHRTEMTNRADTSLVVMPQRSERSATVAKPYDLMEAKMDSLGFRMLVTTSHASLLFGVE